MPLSAPPRIKPLTAITVSIALFVVLDVSILLLNYQLAQQFDDDSLAINLAGRQRMLSQQMARQILEKRVAIPGSERELTLNNDFHQSHDLFRDTLNAFINGGEVMGSDGEPAYLRPRTDVETLAVLHRAQAIWQSYREDLATIEIGSNNSAIDLSEADKLLVTVNELTTLLEHQARDKANILRWIQSTAVVVVLFNFAFILWHIRRRFNQVTNSNAMLQDLVDKISAPVLLFNNNQYIHYANRAAGLLFRLPVKDLIGKSRQALIQQLDEGFIGFRGNGERFSVHIEQRELIFNELPVQVITITELHLDENEVHWRHLAYHDSLTGLPNRLLFEHRIKYILSAAHRLSEYFAVLTIDLDNFKDINDKHGHIAGDDVLRTIAQRFREKIRNDDLIARLGGDEFVVVLTRFKSQIVAHQTVKQICRYLLNCLHDPIKTNYDEVVIKGSIGVSFYPIDGEVVRDILYESDAAMYRAKASGGGCEFLRRAG